MSPGAGHWHWLQTTTSSFTTASRFPNLLSPHLLEPISPSHQLAVMPFLKMVIFATTHQHSHPLALTSSGPGSTAAIHSSTMPWLLQNTARRTMRTPSASRKARNSTGPYFCLFAYMPLVPRPLIQYDQYLEVLRVASMSSCRTIAKGCRQHSHPTQRTSPPRLSEG